MSLIKIFPSFEVIDGLSTEEKSWLIARDYGICNGWRVNFAVNQIGESFGVSGTSQDVSSDLDKQLLIRLRSLADVIVTSGKTARSEKYKSSKFAPIAIFTKSADLDAVPAIQGTQFFTPLVLVPASSRESIEDALIDVDVRVLDYTESAEGSWPSRIATLIRHEGLQSPILESGFSTLTQFIANGVVDEICLSVSDRSGVGLSARDASHQFLERLFGMVHEFILENLYSDGQTLFMRWVRNGVAARSLDG